MTAVLAVYSTAHLGSKVELLCSCPQIVQQSSRDQRTINRATGKNDYSRNATNRDWFGLNIRRRP
jgi:hypothetical protein